MTRQILFFLLLLTGYSLTLVGLEWTHSQAYVRNYFTDLEGPVLFYGINTTVSTCLMWSTALLFLISHRLGAMIQAARRELWFLLSQIVIFLYLGFDERFLLHEKLGRMLHFEDAFILLGIGLIELGCLFGLGRLHQRSRTEQAYLFLAGCSFGMMIVIDGFLPGGMRLRLSFEDLSKLWAVCFLFLFSWQVLFSFIQRLSNRSVSASTDIM